MTDEDKWDQRVAEIRPAIEALVIEFFRPRCVDFDPHCPICRKWRQVDELLENPFEEGK